MASTVYAIPGKLYLDPTDATTGGTEIVGIEGRRLSFEHFFDPQRRKSSLKPGYMRMLRGPMERFVLRVPLRGNSSTALKILFSPLTTSGTSIGPHSGTAALLFAKLPTFAIVLRPDSTSERYLYAPNWALAPETIAQMIYSDAGPMLSGSEMLLEPMRPTNATGRPWLWDTAANINTEYGLGGE